jgi:VIT1/CCC1 family predicted Fe2+/Mn2+ transporter
VQSDDRDSVAGASQKRQEKGGRLLYAVTVSTHYLTIGASIVAVILPVILPVILTVLLVVLLAVIVAIILAGAVLLFHL